MNLTVFPSNLEGTVQVPPSKSIMQRVLACALLSEGTTRIINPDFSNDSLAALKAIGSMGATIEEEGDNLLVTGGIKVVASEINMEESGLGIRLFTPIAGLLDIPITLTAEGSLKNRPMHWFREVIESLGCTITMHEGQPPIQICGPIQNKALTLDGSLSSQFISGILIALASTGEEVHLKIENLVSSPYLELTIEVLRAFGIEVSTEDLSEIHIPAGQSLRATDITIDGDWSAGATLLCAGAVAAKGNYSVRGLQRNFTQADQSIIGTLLFAGMKLLNEQGEYHLKGGKIRGFEIDATHCPDLFPCVAAMAVFAKGKVKIKGVHRLKNKESDRAQAIVEEFGNVGIKVEIIEDVMTVYPGKPIPGKMFSHNDHRMAFAAAIIGLKGGPVTIEEAQCVGKSYPSFFDDLMDLGAKIESD